MNETDVWYFMVVQGEVKHDFTLTLQILNGVSHFSEENSGLHWIFILIIVSSVPLLGLNMMQCLKEMAEKEKWDNPLHFTMLASCTMIAKSVM